MNAQDLIQDTLARVVWLREESNPYEREQALEDLELDLAGWLARHQNEAAPLELREAA